MVTRQETLDLSWLTPERLIDFIDGLRDAGYNVGVTQYAIAQDLVLTLATQNQVNSVERLRAMLGSVLCSTPFEQQNFRQRFNDWLDLLKVIEEPSLPLERELEKVERQSKRTKWILISAALICVGLLTPVLIRPKPEEPEPQPENTEIPAEVPVVQPPVTAAEPLPEDEGGLLEQIRDFIFALFRWELKWLPWLSAAVLAILIPCLAFVLWRLWWERKARQFLQRYAADKSLELSSISTLGLQESLFAPAVLLNIARQLRRRVTIPSIDLDIDKTLDASLDQGGWLTPVYGDRKVLPEYLCLIEQSSYRDHQTQFVQEAVTRLTENGVFIAAYTFNGDPRICSPHQTKGTPKRLSELVAKYSGHRLLIFAETEAFFRSDTGRLAAWTQTLSRWQERAVLTPKPKEHWDYQEEELSNKFTVLPGTINGLELLTQKLQADKKDPIVKSKVNRPPFPEALRLHPRRWIERNPPTPEQLQSMQIELQEYLADGYYWLCACAIFPKLTWNLTVFLGNTIKNESGISLLEASSINNLIRLPWFRYGYMPDWLRIDLIRQLTIEQEKDIRRSLHELLITLIRGEDNEGFEIIHSHPRLVSQLAKPVVRLLAKQAAIGTEFQDSIFVNFMLARTDRLLAVEIPDSSNILENRYSQKIAWLQPVGFATGALIISLGINQVFNTNRGQIDNSTDVVVNDFPLSTEPTVSEPEPTIPESASTISEPEITILEPTLVVLGLEPTIPTTSVISELEVDFPELTNVASELEEIRSIFGEPTVSETLSANSSRESVATEITPTTVVPATSDSTSNPATSNPTITPTPPEISPISTPNISTENDLNLDAILKLGDRGIEVSRLQNELQRLGYAIEVSGVFGAQTYAAVRDFQRRTGLSVDGIVGPITLESVRAVQSIEDTTNLTTSSTSNASEQEASASEKLPTPIILNEPNLAVVIPNATDTTLAQVRQFIPEAQLIEYNGDIYVLAGTSISRDEANSLSLSLRSFGLDTQVIPPSEDP